MVSRKATIIIVILVCLSAIGIAIAANYASHTDDGNQGDVSYFVLKLKDGDTTVSVARFNDSTEGTSHTVYFADKTSCSLSLDKSHLPEPETGKVWKFSIIVRITAPDAANGSLTVKVGSYSPTQVGIDANGQALAQGYTWDGTSAIGLSMSVLTKESCKLTSANAFTMQVTIIAFPEVA